MEGDRFQIAIWKIENFSCWNQDLHEECIENSEIGFSWPNLRMKLYPRGTSGQEEHMAVHLSILKQVDEFSGDLSFIDADGSTLCMQRVQSNKDGSDIVLPPGPKFEEVKIKENKDHLILRLQIKCDYRYDVYHLCSIIQVFDVTLEVDSNIILKDDKTISAMRYTHDEYNCDLNLRTGKIREDKYLELYLDPSTEDAFSVKTHLSLISSVGSLIRYEKNEHLFHEGEPWTFSDSLSKEELSENTRLILSFKIISGEVNHTLRNVFVCFDDVKIVPNHSKSVCEESAMCSASANKDNAVGILSKELMCLFQDQDFSDLLLKCQSVSFPVHKAILSARSTVFKTMLSSDMTEAATGCVDIADLETSTLVRFLAFLYTGIVEDLQGESALKLYYAADKYHVPSLKRECVSFLTANVCVSNVCDVLSIGDKHQDGELSAAAHNFLLRNFDEVLKSKEWDRFMRREPLLAVETVTHFATKGFVGNLNPFRC